MPQDWLNSLNWHAFCHRQPDRCFAYDAGLYSLLCHRCSGIYGGFLWAWITAAATRWKGRWGLGGVVREAGVALFLLFLSLVQVLAEDNLGPSFWTQPFLRFLLGCLAGLALLQLASLIEHDQANRKAPFPWTIAILFTVAFLFHYELAFASHAYIVAVTIAGITALYLRMNLLVAKSFWPRLAIPTALALAAFMSGLEWWGLSWIQAHR